jgi:hypothetical protein
MRTVFKDGTLQGRYERNGYVTVPALDVEQVEELRQRYSGLPPIDDAGWSMRVFLDPASHSQVIDGLLARYLRDYIVLLGSFFSKKPGKGSTVAPHCDWTFVDEDRCASMQIWIPLVDTKQENGALYLLRGSHKLVMIRGTRIRRRFALVEHLLDYEQFDYLPLKAGEAVFFDHRIIHRSSANMTNEPRIAVAVTAVPSDAELIHFIRHKETNRLQKYRVPLDFILRCNTGHPPEPPLDGATFVRNVDELQPFTQEEMALFLATREAIPSQNSRAV